MNFNFEFGVILIRVSDGLSATYGMDDINFTSREWVVD